MSANLLPETDSQSATNMLIDFITLHKRYSYYYLEQYKNGLLALKKERVKQADAMYQRKHTKIVGLKTSILKQLSIQDIDMLSTLQVTPSTYGKILMDGTVERCVDETVRCSEESTDIPTELIDNIGMRVKGMMCDFPEYASAGAGRITFKRMKFIRYHVGGFFNEHQDTTEGLRGIFCVKAPIKGGEFVVTQEQIVETISMMEGMFIIFNGFCLHRANKVLEGTKEIITFDIYIDDKPFLPNGSIVSIFNMPLN